MYGKLMEDGVDVSSLECKRYWINNDFQERKGYYYVHGKGRCQPTRSCMHDVSVINY